MKNLNRAELVKGGKGFQVVANNEVLIDVTHRQNLIKNLRTNKKVQSLGIVELEENGKVIYDLVNNKSLNRGRTKNEVELVGAYAGILKDLMKNKEFKHSDLLKATKLKRPNAELLKDLNLLVGNKLKKVNLGVGKGVVYKLK